MHPAAACVGIAPGAGAAPCRTIRGRGRCLLGGTVFARQGGLSGSRFAAEFMGVEAVHRALALQSLGRLGNDRAFMRFATREEVPGLPTSGTPGFYRITDAVTALEGAGFGKQGPSQDSSTSSTR